jgi:acyl-CoA hydrolase
MTFGCADHVSPRYAGSFRHRALFVGPNVREAVNDGRADFVPVFLSEIPRLIQTGALPVEVALVHLSPPDEHGFCSYGVGVECTKAAAEQAKTVVALVNRQMPRSLGDSFIHVSRLTHVVEVDRPLLELPRSREAGDVARSIGRNVAELVEDGSTLQMGIGEIPDAVLLFLKDKRHLGIHTEMFSALAVDLTGQVCADSLGRSIYSGFGGQVDFVRGAARAKGGKPIIALPSTACDGKVSRIVDTLAEGSGVVTTRADVHYVVTEHGIARLYGKCLRERAQELIAVAHPDFREELRAAARRRHL